MVPDRAASSPTLFALPDESVAEALLSLRYLWALGGMSGRARALYANDMLLFLHDAGPSLLGAL